MTKEEARKIIRDKGTAKNKEALLKQGGATFTHDSKQNLIVWCSDGVITFSPIYKH